MASNPSRALDSPATLIAQALQGFFNSGGEVARVFGSQGTLTPPQPLAYVVHFPRLSVTLSGTDSMWAEQEGRALLLHAHKGNAVLIPAHGWNRPVWSKPFTTLNLLFGRRQIGVSLVTHTRESPAEPIAIKTTLPESAEQTTRHLLQALLLLDLSNSRAACPLVQALLHAIFEALSMPAPTPRRRAAGVYEGICMYLQENYAFPVTRESVARHYRLSPNHVSRLFKREGMVSFNDYVNYVRINRAKYLLKSHRQTIDEISAACGFRDASYFCRVFKRKTRQTPGEYRETAREKA
ncbi:MAG TPA: AraC family transcriptional regulator [Opitutaceae bacterium]|nr:AraC family transcriptional regulator [Opitutaceae bacterium]